MRRLTLAAFVVALLQIGGAFAPVQAEQLVIPGSGNPTFVLSRLADAFNARQTSHRVVVPASSGMAGAVRDVTTGTAVLGRAGRPLTDDERRKGLKFVSFGREPVVFVGGAGVKVAGITRDQAVGIYSGKYTDWADLGGPPGPIRAIGRERTDATLRAISREIAAFDGIAFHDGVKLVHLDPDVITLLDRYPTSFGFLNRSGLLFARTPLVLMALDGVAPSSENLKSGRYPLWQESGLIHLSGQLTEGAQAFLAFVRSPDGVAILQQHGFVAPAKVP
jgi:phosphate transport system substrate-binding protein